MPVRLAEVTADNWEAVAELEVSNAEAAFVASNLYSLAQSKFEPGARPLAICVDGTPVGFIMYEADPDDAHTVMLYRFMVGRQYRGCGYGRAGLELFIGGFERDPSVHAVKVCFVAENVMARRLYATLGFIEIGYDEDGEVLAQRRLTSTEHHP